MSHCISLFLVKSEDLRSSKIDSVLESYEFYNANFIKLDANILATTNIKKTFSKENKDVMVAEIYTDYFGGVGYQSAKLYLNGKTIYNKSSEYQGYPSFTPNPINEVLKTMGVITNGKMDEFDTIGLSKYRSNESIDKLIEINKNK